MLQGHPGLKFEGEKKFISFLLLRPDGGRFVTNFPYIPVIAFWGRDALDLAPPCGIFEAVGKSQSRDF